MVVTVDTRMGPDWVESWVATWGDRVVQFLAAYTGDAVLAQDLAQDTFLKVYDWRVRHPKAPVQPGILFSTARNLARDRWRRDERERRALERAGTPPSEPAAETAVLVRDLIDRLAPSDRDCLLLFYYGDLSTDDIADVLRVSPITVRVRLSRARARLRAGWLGAGQDVTGHGREGYHGSL